MRKLPLLLLLPLAAHATEAELSCAVERSRTEVRAAILEAPAVVGSVGQDPASGSKSISAGLSQSLSGRSQAAKLRQAAEARCAAIAATVELDNYGRFALIQARRDAAWRELDLIKQAIDLAQEHISQLDAQLAAQTITIQQHTETRQVLVALEQRSAALQRTLSTVPPRQGPIDVPRLIATNRANEALAARLVAGAAAASGWEVRLTGGGRQELQSGQTKPFVGLALTYSFGYRAAADAATRIETQTADLLAVQTGGFTQLLARQAAELTELINAETLAAAAAARHLQHLTTVREQIQGVDTALANNVRRSIDVQLLMLSADQIGAETRLARFKALLQQLQ